MTTQTAMPQASNTRRENSRWEWVAVFLFWTWNLIFLAFMSLGFAPTMLPNTFIAVRAGLIPVPFLIYALILASIPVIAVVLGLTVLRSSPSRQFALGYVVEGPLMLLLIVRFFAIRQATPGSTLLLVVALLGIGAFLWDLLSPQGKRLPWLRLLGLTLMAMVALYAAVWILFYALPILGFFWEWLVRTLADLPLFFRNLLRGLVSMIRDTPYMVSFAILGFILFIYTATLFAVAPIAVPYLSLRAWWRSLSATVDRYGWLRPTLLVSATIVVWAGLFVVTNRQPQKLAFNLLEKPPTSAEEARELVKRSPSIRAGLLNAYLAPYRYISAIGEVRHISTLYQDAFNLPPQDAFAVQGMYEAVASPLIYAPVHRSAVQAQSQTALVSEPEEAAQLYQRFFDTPINDGERETVVSAARSTWSGDQAEAAWQAVDDREVHLVSQDITITPHGDFAQLELHEAYQNQTGEQQEVVYYINLPESAAITGLWLGNSPDKSQAFQYQVAPRGAAQAVYREETRKMRDPALVEQIGPRQYRLRAYPVPPLMMDFDQNTGITRMSDAPVLHLWLSWTEMAVDGAAGDAWPLPQLAEKRNLYWDENTLRTVNGASFDVENDAWLPETLPADSSITPVAHRSDLTNGQSVLAIPAGQAELPALPDPLRLAVVLDRSRSMEPLAAEVAAALETIREATGSQPVDVYLTASPYRGEQPSVTTLDQLDPSSIVYFGGQNAGELLAQFEEQRLQFEEQRGGQTYDAAVVITDGSGYELGESGAQISPPEMPVWLVHLGGELPLGYDDQTLEAIQASGGGVTGDIDTALARLAVSRSSQYSAESSPTADLLDGYLWLTLPTNEADSALPAGADVVTHAPGDPFTPLAARQAILAEMQRMHASLDQLENLDQLHALAVENSIVTPYSSMIVLVNFQQEQLLKDLSNQGDRYQREVEAIGETTTRSPVPLLGVPEPHEWLLLGLAAAFLIYIAYTKRANLLNNSASLRLR